MCGSLLKHIFHLFKLSGKYPNVPLLDIKKFHFAGTEDVLL